MVKMKQELFDYIEQNRNELLNLADYIYDQAECGCEEFNSQAALCAALEKHGFQVEKGIGGLPTAFRAVYQSLGGGIRLGLMCEYDALYGIGHACGHHMQGPSALGTAFAVKDVLGEKIPFDLVVYGCPDEEGYADGGKQVMIDNGCFNDVDLVMIMHGGTETTTDVRTLAATGVHVRFTPKEDSYDADLQSRAMDAMLMAFQGTEFLREHILDDARIHYTYWIRKSKPGCCVADFSVRAKTMPYFQEMKQRFRSIIDGAAEMMGADVEYQYGREFLPKFPVQTIIDTFYENAALAGAERIEEPRKRVGSADTANVLYKVPGIGIRITFAPKGTSAHSREWLAQGKTEAGHNCVLIASKTMAGMVYDFLEQPEKIVKARQEFEQERKLLNSPADRS